MKIVTTLSIVFFVASIFLLDLSIVAEAGTPIMDTTTCCQYVDLDGQDFCIQNQGATACPVLKEAEFVDGFVDSTCNENSGLCNVSSTVPTLSEWSLIAVAAVLGVIGYIVIRRRQAAVKV